MEKITESFEWTQEEVDKINRLILYDVAPERWERARWGIDFKDMTLSLLEDHKMLRNYRGNKLSCPIHGGMEGDSTPSFTFYPSSNSAYCFGCEPPSSNQCYDNVKLVSLILGVSRTDALIWLEKKYKLPPIGLGRRSDPKIVGDDEEEEDKEEIISLNFEDLREPFLQMNSVRRDSPEELSNVLKVYFQSEHTDDPLPLAKVLGSKRVAQLLQRKVKHVGKD